MRKLKELAFTFSTITTCTIIAATVFISIFWKETTIDTSILWQILVCSFFCTLGNLLYTQEEKSKQQFYALLVLHYLYINAVVLLSGLFFQWFYADNPIMVLTMITIIAIVFSFVYIMLQIRSKRDAAVMNERLKAYIKKRNVD